MATTAAEHLTLVIHHWPDLQEALGGASAPTWPPAGRMNDYLRALDEADAEQVEAERHRALALRTLERDPAQIGEQRLPIRLPIHETMRIVRAVLVETADQIAEHVQRKPISPPPPRRAAVARTRGERLAWEDHARRVQAVQDDAADARRWKWTGTRPDAPYAALWLLGRVQGSPGPFRPLNGLQLDHIATVARGCALRVEDALDVGERRATLARPCPTCGGQLHLHGGAGAAPVARCTSCGHIWTQQTTAA